MLIRVKLPFTICKFSNYGRSKSQNKHNTDWTKPIKNLIISRTVQFKSIGQGIEIKMYNKIKTYAQIKTIMVLAFVYATFFLVLVTLSPLQNYCEYLSCE